MQTTALFVELLVIGAGSLLWLAPVLAMIFGNQTDPLIFKDNTALLVMVAAIAYVLGIVLDRIARTICSRTIENWARSRVFTRKVEARLRGAGLIHAEGNMSIQLEKFIQAHSETLGNRITYNRSRLRICRAWMFHFLLAGIALWFWDHSIRMLPATTMQWLLLLDAILFALTFIATLLLARDHQADLLESFNVLTAKLRNGQDKETKQKHA